MISVSPFSIINVKDLIHFLTSTEYSFTYCSFKMYDYQMIISYFVKLIFLDSKYKMFV